MVYCTPVFIQLRIIGTCAAAAATTATAAAATAAAATTAATAAAAAACAVLWCLAKAMRQCLCSTRDLIDVYARVHAYASAAARHLLPVIDVTCHRCTVAAQWL